MTEKRPNAYAFLSAWAAHVNGGVILLIAAFLALLVANSSLGDYYQQLWNLEVHLRIGEFNLFSHNGENMSLMTFINDALMAIFFFSVGLEIKREVLVGELSSFKQAMLPIIAAIGGMVVPVMIFWSFTHGTPAEAGMATPMATDIAFSLGVLSLFGKRVPISLKVFLTAFAVVDDIGGILVIALFYSNHIALDYLLMSGAVLAVMLAGNFYQVRNKSFYVVMAVLLWYLFLQSGVHATIAGVVAAFTVPATPNIHIGKYLVRMRTQLERFSGVKSGSVMLDHDQINVLKSIESAGDHVVSPLQKLEDNLHGFVNYVIMPIFAFANAGVVLFGEHGVTFGMVTTATAVGLILGKFIGIYLFTYLAIKLHVAAHPEGLTWKNLSGICMLGGIGFTVSLFIANLSFGSDLLLLNQTKLGVLLGTIVAGVFGYVILHFTLPREEQNTDRD